MDNIFTINKKSFIGLLARMSVSHKVFVPYKENEHFYFKGFDSEKSDKIEFGGIRQSQPVKSFLNPARESVLHLSEKNKKVVIAGVKACDLKGFIVQDHVFKDTDPKDPFYIKNRENTFIISADCTYAKESCFCTAMAGGPYPEESFDINLSDLGEYWLAEAGSDKGRVLMKERGLFFRVATDSDLRRRDKMRNEVSASLKASVEKKGTPDTKVLKGTVKKQYDLVELWQDQSSTCVECGACNLVCPTCHCFLLYDEEKGGEKARTKIWDSCLYKTFARVAGGANPRRRIYERLRNRIDKKFNFFPETLNHFACTGCGRCIEACPGDIDIREVLKGVASGKWEKPPHK